MLEYETLYDNTSIVCFVGKSATNKHLHQYYSQHRASELHLLEDLDNKDQSWFDQRQFICTITDLAVKKKIISKLDDHQVNYFSVVSTNIHQGFDVSIGRGSYIKDFNTLLDGAQIGNHTILTHYCNLSHYVTIGDFCHISPFTYFVFCNIGPGNYVGVRSTFIGTPNSVLTTTENCNFLVGSTVTKSITTPATYLGNRQTDKLNSLERPNLLRVELGQPSS